MKKSKVSMASAAKLSSMLSLSLSSWRWSFAAAVIFVVLGSNNHAHLVNGFSTLHHHHHHRHRSIVSSSSLSSSSPSSTSFRNKYAHFALNTLPPTPSKLVAAASFVETDPMEEDETKKKMTMTMSNPDDHQQQLKKKKQSTDPTPVVLSWLQQSNLKPATFMATLALTLVLLLSSSPMPSWAAMSGGRMGGSFSSGGSRGGGGGGYSRSYSSSPSYGGSRGGYIARPSVSIITPFYSPIVPVQPFFFGGGPGVIAYSRGPSLLDLFLFGGLVFAITSFVRSAEEEQMGESNSLWSSWGGGSTTALGSGTSVVQVSVALEVPNRDDPQSILSVLNRLAATAKTDSRVGLSNLTSQVALELLRRKSSIVSASSDYQHYNDRNKAQREFQSKAIQERGKFENELVSQYGGVDYSNTRRLAAGASSSSSSSSSTSPQATMAVVTLLLAIDGDSTKVPSIRTMADVEDALRKVAADAKVDDCLQSCEILWTPEDRSETLTLREVVADYPNLRSL